MLTGLQRKCSKISSFFKIVGNIWTVIVPDTWVSSYKRIKREWFHQPAHWSALIAPRTAPAVDQLSAQSCWVRSEQELVWSWISPVPSVLWTFCFLKRTQTLLSMQMFTEATIPASLRCAFWLQNLGSKYTFKRNLASHTCTEMQLLSFNYVGWS